MFAAGFSLYTSASTDSEFGEGSVGHRVFPELKRVVSNPGKIWIVTRLREKFHNLTRDAQRFDYVPVFMDLAQVRVLTGALGLFFFSGQHPRSSKKQA
jgi:hypothetical protein